MSQPRRCAGFAQKTKPRRFVTEIFFTDSFHPSRAARTDAEPFLSPPPPTAAQLDRFPVFIPHQFIVLKSLGRPFRCRYDSFFERRLASKTLSKHAHRAEFDCSRKLVTAARAGSLGLGFHRPTPLASMRLRKHGCRRPSLLDLAS